MYKKEKDKDIKPLGSPCNVYPLLSVCKFCGFFWTCSKAICCPSCDSGNIRIVPIPLWDNPKFNFGWLSRNGFDFIRERLGVDEMDHMLTEFEVRNLRDMYIGRLDAIVDPVEHKCVEASICVLECVLND